MKNFFNSAVIHFAEISLKGKNKNYFVKKLKDNLKNTLESRVSFKATSNKIILENLDWEKDKDKLRKIFGIAYFSPAKVVKTDLDLIKETALQILEFYKPKTFKIESSRAYKKFSLNSIELSQQVAGYIFKNKSFEIKADVHDPELTIKVELEKDFTSILGQKEAGLGGLPVGVTGSVLSLISGGIDSPVASWMLQKRGAKVKYIHFFNQTINKVSVKEKIKDLVKKLSEYQGKSELFIIPFADLQKEVVMKVPADLRMIVYRRLMFQISEIIAQKEKCQALVTGDNLAQVASQTLENMSVIYQATNLLRFHPLIGFDKQEIVNLSQRIGTYEISIQPYEDCCNLLVAKHPETRSNLEKVLEVEKNLDLKLIDQAVENLEKIILS